MDVKSLACKCLWKAVVTINVCINKDYTSGKNDIWTSLAASRRGGRNSDPKKVEKTSPKVLTVKKQTKNTI